MTRRRNRRRCQHQWHSDIMIPSRVLECDWCVRCSIVRPGYKDPKEKWDDKRNRPIRTIPLP